MVGSSARESPFIGRQRETAELARALEDAFAGNGRVVMLVGEPGMGKTRTAQELAAIAGQRDAQVLWGRCYEGEGAPPYWPWIQCIRACVEAADAQALSEDMGAGAAYIAEIVPEVRQRLPGLQPAPALEPQQARFRLFDSVVNFLKKASHVQPITLILEDLHWADRSSLLFLEFLAAEIAGSRLLVLGTHREVDARRRHPLSNTLGSLVREQQFHRVRLQGLSQEEVGQFVRAMSEANPSAELLKAVHQHTEGNPLFVIEMVRLLKQQQGIQDADIRRLGVPEGVRDTIGRRLSRLSDVCQQALVTASVIGREFDLKALQLVNDDISDERLFDALDEALEARMIEDMPVAARRFQFTHSLVRQTLVEELSAMRRGRLHARIGKALERLYEGSIEVHASELAHHFGEAQAILGTDKLLRYSIMAGEWALASHAYMEALDHFERALAAKEEPAPSIGSGRVLSQSKGQLIDGETAAILLGLGRARAATFPRERLQEAVLALGRALEYYAAKGEFLKAIAAADVPMLPQEGLTTIAKLASRALELVPLDSYEAGRLLCWYGAAVGIEEGDYERACEALERAIVIARREHDAALEMRAVANVGILAVRYFHLEEGVRHNLRALELAQHLDEPFIQAIALQYAILGLGCMGELEQARHHILALTEVNERMRVHYMMTMAQVNNAFVSTIEGNWQAARILSNRWLALSPREPSLTALRTMLEYQLGEFDQGNIYLDRLLEAVRLTPPGPSWEYAWAACVVPAVARITGIMDKLDMAQAIGQTVISSPVTPGRASVARAGLALIAVQREDIEMAAEQYAVIRPLAGLMHGHAVAFSFDRLLGLLARTLSKLDISAGHFEDALAMCRKAGHLSEMAWCCYDYADTLLQRSGPGDAWKANSLLNESLRIATELGMLPLIEQISRAMESLQALPLKKSEYPNGLTAREIEVLRLVASGRSNAEIANKLVLSIKTVERHISNIYSKTNTHSRAEVTAFAFTHGLIPSNKAT